MKKLTPDPREPWAAVGEIIKIGEFRLDWIQRLTGPRVAEFIKTYRSKGEGRYVISGQLVGGVRHIALLNFNHQVVRFTTVNATYPGQKLLVEQLDADEFWRRFGLAQIKNPYRDGFAQEATLVVWETLLLGNRGRRKFELENLDTALAWLGMTDGAETIRGLC